MPAPARSPAFGPADPLVALADRCVQCGLCLPACPTYGTDRLEAESPRGRIALARAWALQTIDVTPTGQAHLDHCLGCRSCESVCPAGVKYGELLIQARERQRAVRRPAWTQRVLEALAGRPRILAAVMATYRRVFPALPSAWRPLPRPPAPQAPEPPSCEADTALFVGCIAREYEGPLRHAVTRLCAASGQPLQQPAAQTCCGSLHAHGGDPATGARLADSNRRAFAGARTVLTLASGCHEAVAQSLSGQAETLDAIAFIAARADALRFRPAQQRIALHLPCTQRNVVRSTAALRTLLARVPDLEVIELDAGYGCCGAAGTQMFTEPARAITYRQPLLAQCERSGATRLLSANIGCRLHLGNGTAMQVQHPLEFLAELLEPAHPRTAAHPVQP